MRDLYYSKMRVWTFSVVRLLALGMNNEEKERYPVPGKWSSVCVLNITEDLLMG
jgi:hypothetical protein